MTALESARAYARALMLLVLACIIHESGHAAMAGLFGYAVPQFVLGMGPPLVSWTPPGWTTAFGIAPLPLGAYVTLPEYIGRWQEVVVTMAGPGINLGMFLFHPYSPLSLWLSHKHYTQTITSSDGVQTSTRQKMTWRVSLVLSLTHLYSYLKVKLKKKDPLTSTPSYWDAIPFIDTMRMIKGLTLYEISFILGVTNLLPIPPMDGGHILFRAVVSQTPTGDTGYGVVGLVVIGYLLLVHPFVEARRIYKLRHSQAPSGKTE